jgi:hypothetical protein
MESNTEINQHDSEGKRHGIWIEITPGNIHGKEPIDMRTKRVRVEYLHGLKTGQWHMYSAVSLKTNPEWPNEFYLNNIKLYNSNGEPTLSYTKNEYGDISSIDHYKSNKKSISHLIQQKQSLISACMEHQF